MTWNVTIFLSSFVSTSTGLLDAGTPSPSSPAPAPLCPAPPGGLVVFDAGSGFGMTWGFASGRVLGEVAPSVEFATTAIPREASLAIDLIGLVVGGTCIVWERPSAGAALFLGGVVTVELVRVAIGRVQCGNTSWKR